MSAKLRCPRCGRQHWQPACPACSDTREFDTSEREREADATATGSHLTNHAPANCDEPYTAYPTYPRGYRDKLREAPTDEE